MTKRTMAALTAVLVVAVLALVEVHEHEPHERELPGWVALHCSKDAVRARHQYRTYVNEEWPDRFALPDIERECRSAAAASAEPEPADVRRRPWNVFCSTDGLRDRHPNADDNLLIGLQRECRDALQAAADAQQELRRCRYTSISVCGPDTECSALDDELALDQRWLEVPPLDSKLFGDGLAAAGGRGPWPTVRRCNSSGCDRIEIYPSRVGVFLVLARRYGPWFAKFLDASRIDPGLNDRVFMEMSTRFLDAVVSRGSCPEAFSPRQAP